MVSGGGLTYARAVNPDSGVVRLTMHPSHYCRGRLSARRNRHAALVAFMSQWPCSCWSINDNQAAVRALVAQRNDRRAS